MNRLGLVTYVAREYDEAIGFFVGKLGFTLIEDTDMGGGKRWVVVSAGEGASLLIARAEGDKQVASVGNQTGGRVGFFLQTDNFDRDFAEWTARGVKFHEQPRREVYGTVAVFEDVYGNTWDLIQPA
ncbi:MAG: VOC family protein [Actinomycetota bacterium]|jgi:catechol 2,3-dioxygenase-like lactoylglutathione lyase family enzyme